MDGNGVPRALAGPRFAPSRRRIPVIETPSPATSCPDPLHPLDFQHQADEVPLALNLALTPVDGLLTGHCTATDARARNINAASAAERSNGRGASRSPGQIETCLVGLRRSLARAVAALQSYLLESQQAHDECVGLNRIAHLAPVDKSTLCVADYAENLNPCELSPHIVVGFVPVLLEIDEYRRYAATQAGLPRPPRFLGRQQGGLSEQIAGQAHVGAASGHLGAGAIGGCGRRDHRLQNGRRVAHGGAANRRRKLNRGATGAEHVFVVEAQASAVGGGERGQLRGAVCGVGGFAAAQ